MSNSFRKSSVSPGAASSGSWLRCIALAVVIVLSFSGGFAAGATTDGVDDADKKVAVEAPRELSTAPLAYPVYPDDRPVWIDAPDVVEHEYAELVVRSVPSLSIESSRESLTEQQRVAVKAYVDSWLGMSKANDGILPSVEQIEAELVDPERIYRGRLTTSTGEMHEHATVLRLDTDFHRETYQRWQAAEVGNRLKGLGVLGLFSFLALAAATGLLKSFAPRQRMTT